MTNTQNVTDREVLKHIAKTIRMYLKETGGTFGVRVQRNNVIWISGQYTFGVEYDKRQEADNKFSKWLAVLAESNGLNLHDGGIHRILKFGEFGE